MKRSPNLPAHVQFFLPIIKALKKLGGSASPSELEDTLVGMLQITEGELQEMLKNGPDPPSKIMKNLVGPGKQG
jgi:restriction system protein